MKEMCRNFICNNNGCPAASTAQSANLSYPNNSKDCSTCVMERVGAAQAYVPSQNFTQPMEQEQSLVCGTVFSDLAMPYCSGWNLYRFRREA